MTTTAGKKWGAVVEVVKEHCLEDNGGQRDGVYGCWLRGYNGADDNYKNNNQQMSSSRGEGQRRLTRGGAWWWRQRSNCCMAAEASW